MGGCLTNKTGSLPTDTEYEYSVGTPLISSTPEFYKREWRRLPIQGFDHIFIIEYQDNKSLCLEFTKRPFGFLLGGAEDGDIGAIVEDFAAGYEKLEEYLPKGSKIVHFKNVVVSHLERHQIEHRLKAAQFPFCIQFEAPLGTLNFVHTRFPTLRPSITKSKSAMEMLPEDSEWLVEGTVVGATLSTRLPRNDEYKMKEVFFPAGGNFGLEIDEEGVVQKVKETAAILNVQPKWRITSINSLPFSPSLFETSFPPKKRTKLEFLTGEFISPRKYLIISPDGLIVRTEQHLTSTNIGKIQVNEIVVGVERYGRRLRISSPKAGWVSIRNEKHYRLLLEYREGAPHGIWRYDDHEWLGDAGNE